MKLGIPKRAPEPLASMGEADRILAAGTSFQPVSRAPQDRVHCESLTSDALLVPGPGRDADQRNISMPPEEIKTKFADVLNPNAYDAEKRRRTGATAGSLASPARIPLSSGSRSGAHSPSGTRSMNGPEIRPEPGFQRRCRVNPRV